MKGEYDSLNRSGSALDRLQTIPGPKTTRARVTWTREMQILVEPASGFKSPRSNMITVWACTIASMLRAGIKVCLGTMILDACGRNEAAYLCQTTIATRVVWRIRRHVDSNKRRAGNVLFHDALSGNHPGAYVISLCNYHRNAGDRRESPGYILVFNAQVTPPCCASLDERPPLLRREKDLSKARRSRESLGRYQNEVPVM